MARQKRLESPTLTLLWGDKRQNFTGSCLRGQAKFREGQAYFYEDKSILIHNEAMRAFHFMTKEGRKNSRIVGRGIRRFVEEGRQFEAHQLIAESVSRIYRAFGMAVKVTTGQDFVEQESGEGPFGKYADRADLAAIIQLFAELEKKGVPAAKFYGFTVKDEIDSGESYQFIELINGPSVEQVVGIFPAFAIEYGKSIRFSGQIDRMNQYFRASDERNAALLRAFNKFVRSIRDKIPDIGDLNRGNVLVRDFDIRTGEFDLILIDPERKITGPD